MKTTITKALATAGLIAAVGAAPLMAQGHQGHEHGDDAPRAGMMMHQMMDECPMAHGQMMGAHMILEHADALELTDEQVTRLEALQERQMELRAEMMEAMTTIHEALTPEQREALHEQMESGMHRMMHGGEDGEHRSTMMRGMMGGEGHGAGGGMMGSHAGDCPMMGAMMGGDQEDHAHPGHPDGG